MCAELQIPNVSAKVGGILGHLKTFDLDHTSPSIGDFILFTFVNPGL